jgi:hypothetical protein
MKEVGQVKVKKVVISVIILIFILTFIFSPIQLLSQNEVDSVTDPILTSNSNTYSTTRTSSDPRGMLIDLGTDADVTFYGVEKRDYYGDVLWTGDIDGNNNDELLVSSPWAESQAGNVSVIFTTYQDQFDLEQDAELIIKGKNKFSAQDHFSVCTGDIDGDGKEDIITGACYSNSGPGGQRSSAGEIWVVYGDSKSNLGSVVDLKTNADITIYGAKTGDTSGYTVASGDINGDGKDDILITSRYAPSGSGNGTIKVIYGDTRANLGNQIDLLNSPLTIYGVEPLDYAGSALATGDINGDNKDDIIIGAEMAKGPGNSRTNCGEAYVIYGNTKVNLGSQKMLSSEADLIIYGADDHDHFSHSITTGDVNGDGKQDIIVGADGSDGISNSRFNSGETYVFYGSGSLIGTWDLKTQAPSLIIHGADVGDAAGSSVAAAKINSDNYVDLLIGARYGDGNNNQRENAGEAYVIYGDTSTNLGTTLDLASDSDINLIGHSPNDHSGETVALGDLDGNGKNDIIVGAEDAYSQRGKVYLVYTDPPRIESQFLSLANGHGIDGKMCYARYKPYTINITIIDEVGYDDLESVTLTINLDSFGEIKYQWLAITDSYSEVEDIKGYASISSTSANSSTDNMYTWNLDFNINFNFNFPTEEMVGCSVFCKGYMGLEHSKTYPNIFILENDLDFTGKLVILNSTQEVLTENSWTRGGEALTWTGLKVIYENSENICPDNDCFNVTLIDGYSNYWQDTGSSGKEISIESTEADTSGKLAHIISITEIPDSGTDVSSLPMFYTNVDAKAPPAPQSVVIHADSQTDPQVKYDDDTHIYVTWTPEPDLESEIVGYYYSLTNNEFTTNGIRTTSLSGEFSNIQKGEVNVFVWAEDKAGNIGSSANSSIYIDLQDLQFVDATPESTAWQDTNNPMCSIRIQDEGGAGIDFESIQYSVSNGGITNYGNWYYPEELVIINDDLVDCTAYPIFEEGDNNYIKWRAKDRASTEFVESEDQLIKIDSKEIDFDLTAPEAKVWQIDNKISCSIMISDIGGSGVNASSIEYSVSTNTYDINDNWKSANLVTNSEVIVHTVDIAFLDGMLNYVQWRAKDVAGKEYTYSEDYNIWINTQPQLIISSPSEGAKFLADTNIWFDASESMDLDQDQLSYYWVSDLDGEIGFSAQFSKMISPGKHKITVFVDDGHTHNLSKMFTITSYEIDSDRDGSPDHIDDDDDNDNIPDWWEEQFGLNSKSSADAGIDTDKDGYSNYEEFQLNSSPLNSSDPTSDEGLDGKDDDKTGTIGFGWILVLVVIIIILIVLIAIVIIFLRKNIDSKKDEQEPEDSKVIKIDEGKGLAPHPALETKKDPDQTRPTPSSQPPPLSGQPEQQSLEEPGKVLPP